MSELSSTRVQLSEDEIDDLLYFARAGEQQDLMKAIDGIKGSHSGQLSQAETLAAAVDSETGNTCLHYACANGHTSTISYLINPTQTDSAPEQLLDWTLSTNRAGNTVLHYAALNGHLIAIKLLLEALDKHRTIAESRVEQDPAAQSKEDIIKHYCEVKSDFLSKKNNAGHDAAYEAESNGKENVVNFLLGVMDEADATKAGVTDDQDAQGGEAIEADGEETVTFSVGQTDGTSSVEEHVNGLHISDQKG